MPYRYKAAEVASMKYPLIQKHLGFYEDSFLYRMLSRMQSDCKYYLGYGNRHTKHLWAQDERLQIDLMREIYDFLPEKPEWITLEEISEYESEMCKTKTV